MNTNETLKRTEELLAENAIDLRESLAAYLNCPNEDDAAKLQALLVLHTKLSKDADLFRRFLGLPNEGSK